MQMMPDVTCKIVTQYTLPVSQVNMTYLGSEESIIHQQIHILECLAEVHCKFPKSMVYTVLSSE